MKHYSVIKYKHTRRKRCIYFIIYILGRGANCTKQWRTDFLKQNIPRVLVTIFYSVHNCTAANRCYNSCSLIFPNCIDRSTLFNYEHYWTFIIESCIDLRLCYFTLHTVIILPMRIQDFDQGVQFLGPKVANIAKQSHTSKVSYLRMGSF